MMLFFQALTGVLLTIILVLSLGNQGKETGHLLVMTACGMAAIIAMNYLKPVLDFVMKLQDIGGLDSAIIETMLKVAGISVLSEIASLVCTDAGNSSLGKVVQLLGTSVILWLSIPLFSALIELIQKIMGEL